MFDVSACSRTDDRARNCLSLLTVMAVAPLRSGRGTTLLARARGTRRRERDERLKRERRSM